MTQANLKKGQTPGICRPFVFIVLEILIGFWFPLCVNAAQLVFGLDTTPERLIPIKIKNPQTAPVSMQIYEGLFDVNEQAKVIPRIVEKWETGDFKTWVFYVRKGVYFHKSPIFQDGQREVTAKDVVYSLTRYCSADSYWSFLLLEHIEGAKVFNEGKADTVSGLKVLDSYRLQVNLVKPVPFFINYISSPAIAVFPEELGRKQYAEQNGLSMAVGTGPFAFESMSETEVVLKKNDRYWNREYQPVLDTILFRVINNDQTRLVNLKRNNIDVMVLPTSLFQAVLNKDGSLKRQYEKNYHIKSIETFNSHFIGINNRQVTDINLRRAMFWGTDRRRISKYILYDYGQVTAGTVPPGLNGYMPPLETPLYNLEKARKYLEKSNYKGEPIELVVHNLANSEQIGQIFQSQMAEIGINIVLKKEDFGSAINRIVKGESPLFSMFFEYVFSSPEPILINLFSTAKIPVPNFFAFSNPAIDEMLAKLYSFEKPQASVDYCSDIEATVMKDVPGIFLYRQKYIVLYRNQYTNLEVSGNNHYFMEKIRANP